MVGKKTETVEVQAKERAVQQADPWSVLRHATMTEKSMGLVERENNLIFIVDINATKPQIKKAAEAAFDVKVDSVRTEITRRGGKKAYIRLAKEYSASDIATRLGML